MSLYGGFPDQGNPEGPAVHDGEVLLLDLLMVLSVVTVLENINPLVPCSSG